MPKRYLFNIWQEDGMWLAESTTDQGTFITSGKTQEELWMMIGDAVLTVEDVPVSWWNKFLSNLMIYR
jgi:hypothetical protein